MSYYKENTSFHTGILWCPLLKFEISLFIKRLLDIDINLFRERKTICDSPIKSLLDSGIELSSITNSFEVKKIVGYFRFIHIKKFFTFCAYVNYWYDFRTGISLDIYKFKRSFNIHICLLGLEYKLAFNFLFLKRSCK